MSDSLPPHGPQHTRLPDFAQTHVHWICHAIQPSHPTSCPLRLPSAFLSIRVFFNESALHIRLTTYWSFSISHSNEYSVLISFRIECFDLLAVQGALKSLLYHQSLKASILPCSSLFMVQLSHLYMTTTKTIALTVWTFVGKVMSLLFNMFVSPSNSYVETLWPQYDCIWRWMPFGSN